MGENCKKIYAEMLRGFGTTLEKASEDDCNSDVMTLSQENVVDFDEFKNGFVKKISSSGITVDALPMSCDALYMAASQNEFFMIEFKNGRIKELEIKIKILESLLMLSEEFSATIKSTRHHLNFILVYNEDTSKKQIKNYWDKRADMFGLEHFKNLYFKDVRAYTKEEFEKKFVSVYCAQ